MCTDCLAGVFKEKETIKFDYCPFRDVELDIAFVWFSSLIMALQFFSRDYEIVFLVHL